MAGYARHDAPVGCLFETYFEDLRAYCLRRLAPADANDAVAEVFMIAWRRRDDIPEGEGARMWLYGVARNVVGHARRSAARRVRLHTRLAGLGNEDPVSPEVQVVQRSEDVEVLEALSRLRDHDQEVLRLRVWEELTAPQIAQVLSISTAAAEKRIGRAFRRLERALPTAQSSTTRPHVQYEGGE